MLPCIVTMALQGMKGVLPVPTVVGFAGLVSRCSKIFARTTALVNALNAHGLPTRGMWTGQATGPRANAPRWQWRAHPEKDDPGTKVAIVIAFRWWNRLL